MRCRLGSDYEARKLTIRESASAILLVLRLRVLPFKGGNICGTRKRDKKGSENVKRETSARLLLSRYTD